MTLAHPTPARPRSRPPRHPESALLWWWLREASPVRWRRNRMIGPYAVEFVSGGLIVELGAGPASRHDRIRRAWLATRGYRLLRFSPEEVWSRIGMVMERIERERLAGLPAGREPGRSPLR